MPAPARRFAATKIQPPAPRPGLLIERPGLERRLGQALQGQRLVLVSAAAGFGKTSALARQLQRLPAGTAVAWVSCDEGDAPAQLLACLVAALEPYDPPWRVEPETLIETASRPGLDAAARRTIATEVINALAACEVPHGVIVVDDLHRVDCPEVAEFVGLLVERLAPHWTLCIATRSDPALPLGRWRAQGHLAEFRLDDLRFDPAEAEALMRQAGADPALARSLVERTAGWPVGLRLAAQVLAGRSGDPAMQAAQWTINRQVFDFLAAEVLDRMEADLRRFLLRTSVLTELSPARCAAVAGDPHAAARLEQIERAGLFVSVVGEDEPALRLHDLFREALAQRLARELPDEMPQLLRRAAAGEGDAQRRVALLVRAEAWDEAATVVREQVPLLLTAGVVNDAVRLIEQLPQGPREQLPEVQLSGALTGWARWHWADMLAHADRAAAGFVRRGQGADARLARAYRAVALRGAGRRDDSDAEVAALQRDLVDHPADRTTPQLLSLLQVWMAFDDLRFDRLPALLEAQLDLLERHDGPADLWYQCVPLPPYVGLPGTAPALQRYVRGVLQRTEDGPGELRMLARGLQGSLRLWAGDVSGAVKVLADVAGEVSWRDYPLRATLHTHMPLALGELLLGDAAGFRRDIGVLQDTFDRWGSDSGLKPRLGTEYYTVARWHLAAGDAATAAALFDEVSQLGHPLERPSFLAQRDPLAGYRAWTRGDTEAAADLWQPLLAMDAPAFELMGQASELRLRTAWVRVQQRRLPDAAAVLRPLRARHAGDVDVAGLWIAGPAILSALAEVRWGGLADTAGAPALRRWADQAAALRRAAPAAPEGAPGAPPGGLSEREFEVLQRIAAGEANKVIARTLDLSPHTVKRHVANILDKLALSSRGQAAAWLREHAR